MKPSRPFFFLLSLSVALAIKLTAVEAGPDSKADEWARAVFLASGGERWPSLTRLAFAFNVEADGKTVLRAEHDWDIAAGTDTVTWNGQTVTVDVRRSEHSDDLQRKAYQRWVNDSYWLLMPLKLFDPGVRRTYLGPREIEGVTYEVIELRFGPVGLTPADRYLLYIDPRSKRVALWDYQPTPEKSVRATWENYLAVGGLTLATEHRMGTRRLFFDGLDAR